MRLIDHLRESGMTNKAAKGALSSGKVYVGDAPTADAAREIDPTDVVVRPNAPRLRPWRDVAIVFRDAWLAVVAKPAQFLSVPAPRRGREGNVVSAVRRVVGAAFAVHRLDEGTSGLMMVALTESSQLALKDRLAVHDIERRYVAIVRGDFPTGSVRQESMLVRDRGDGRRGSAPDPAPPDAKRAVSEFRRLGSVGRSQSLLEATLETGRTHQLRIQLSELGHPILGDRVYAPRDVASLTPRLALHASTLGFVHPETGVSHRFVAPLADDLERFVRLANKKTPLASRRR